MTYLIIGFLFFAVGYKVNDLITTFRLVRDKKYIEKTVNKMFEVDKND